MNAVELSKVQGIEACLKRLQEEAAETGLLFAAHLIGVTVLEIGEVLKNGSRKTNGKGGPSRTLTEGTSLNPFSGDDT